MASAPTLLPMFAAMNQVHTSAPTYDLYDPRSLDYNSIDPGLLRNLDLVSSTSESHGNFDAVDNMLSTYFMPTALDDFSFNSQPPVFSPHTSHSDSTRHDAPEDQDYLQHKPQHSSKRDAPRTGSPSSPPTSPTPSRKKRDSVVSSTSTSSHNTQISGAAEQRTRNKEAAVRSRQKRGRENDQLVTDERSLTAKHRALQDCLSGLEQEVFALNNMLLEHKDCDCDVIRQYYQRKAERKKGAGRKK